AIRSFSTSSSSTATSVDPFSDGTLGYVLAAGIRLEETIEIGTGKFRIDLARAQSSIRSGLVGVDDRVVDKVSQFVRLGDMVSCAIAELQPLKARPEDLPLDIVYEDEHWHSGKSHHCGLPAHSIAGNTISEGDDVSDDELSGFYEDSSSSDWRSSSTEASVRPGIVHRLDKGTNGFFVVAKDQHAHADLSEQFRLHTIQRVYISLTSGVSSPVSGWVEVP
ncbi:Pseudouridine synthase, RsuA/RluA-like, partial [Dillenia turbinata]